MKPGTIKHIKNQLRDFLPMIEAIIDCYEHTTDLNLIKQLVKNASHNDYECCNVNHEVREHNMKSLLKVMKLFNKGAERCPSVKYITDEVIMIIEGNEMSDEVEDEMCDICGGVAVHSLDCGNNPGNKD